MSKRLLGGVGAFFLFIELIGCTATDLAPMEISKEQAEKLALLEISKYRSVEGFNARALRHEDGWSVDVGMARNRMEDGSYLVEVSADGTSVKAFLGVSLTPLPTRPKQDEW